MPKYGEVAEHIFLDRNPWLCSHDIAAHERSCECGMRIAIVVGWLQLALFEWPRPYYCDGEDGNVPCWAWHMTSQPKGQAAVHRGGRNVK